MFRCCIVDVIMAAFWDAVVLWNMVGSSNKSGAKGR